MRAMPLCRMIDKECANGEFRVVRNWDCGRPCVGSTLHHHYPRRLISRKPCFSRILQVSRPERTRSLPMRRFEACDEHFAMKPMFYFRRVRGFKE